MGEVIAFQEIARLRRRRVARALHVRCQAILVEAVAAARLALADLPPRWRAVQRARVRKLEDLAAYAATFE